MDPNEALRVLRLTIKQMRVDEHPDIRRAHAEEIAEHFEALDGWLSTGGFAPQDWQPRSEPQPAEEPPLAGCGSGEHPHGYGDYSDVQ